MAMRVRIKDELCQGHAMCYLACPEVFFLSDEDGHAAVVSEIVPPQHEFAVDQAMRSCPEQAIELTQI